MNFAILYCNANPTLSYNDDWLEAFLEYAPGSVAFNLMQLSFRETIKLLRSFNYLYCYIQQILTVLRYHFIYDTYSKHESQKFYFL